MSLFIWCLGAIISSPSFAAEYVDFIAQASGYSCRTLESEYCEIFSEHLGEVSLELKLVAEDKKTKVYQGQWRASLALPIPSYYSVTVIKIVPKNGRGHALSIHVFADFDPKFPHGSPTFMGYWLSSGRAPPPPFTLGKETSPILIQGLYRTFAIQIGMIEEKTRD